jgi:hypothetical protein
LFVKCIKLKVGRIFSGRPREIADDGRCSSVAIAAGELEEQDVTQPLARGVTDGRKRLTQTRTFTGFVNRGF